MPAPVPDGRARARLLSLTAASSAVLVVSALVGFVVGASSDDPARAASAAAASPATTTLPLRVPDPVPTIEASPGVAAAAAGTGAAGTGPSRTGQASTTGDASSLPREPSAAERDRQLAALLASSGATYRSLAVASGAGVPSSGPSSAPSSAPTTGPSTTPSPTPPPIHGPTPAPTPTGPAAAADLVMSSFNVLGSSHTRHGARGRRPGVVRIRGAAQLLAQHDVDVAGFQELQADQARGLLAATHGSWALFPGAGAHRDSENSVGWRTSAFELVRSSTISIPYFDGHHRDMPYVLLRHRASGVQLWVANVHNPAETARFHHQQQWRTQATYLEAGLVRRLQATGAPVFLTGDMNERAPYFCRLTAATPALVAARGGSNGSGGCRPPAGPGIDWIFGSRGAVFSGYAEDHGPLVRRTTDHPVVTTRVHVGTGAFPGATSTITP